jgi:hypothetical protein
VTLSDLIASCESGFSSVSTDSKREGVEISSGGNDVPGDATLRTEPAALYATEELAYGAWLEEFSRLSPNRGDLSLIWVEKPYVETYRITLGDKFNSYRVVRDRYVVRGAVAIEAYVDADIPLPAEILGDGAALRCAEHPVGTPVAEDREPSESSIETIEIPEENILKPTSGLKIGKRKAKVA